MSTKEEQKFIEELKPLEGKWVALVDKKVVAFGDNPKEVQGKAEEAGYTDFSFYLVPFRNVSFAP